MAYKTDEDDRVHLTPDDIRTLAPKVMEFIRQQAVGDLEGPLCDQCLTRAMIYTTGLLATDAIKNVSPERGGIAQELAKGVQVLGEIGGNVALSAALDGGGLGALIGAILGLGRKA